MTEDKKETGGMCSTLRERSIELDAKVNACRATIDTLDAARNSLIDDAQDKLVAAEEQGAIYMQLPE